METARAFFFPPSASSVLVFHIVIPSPPPPPPPAELVSIPPTRESQLNIMGLLGSVFLGLITVLVALLAPTVIHWGTIAGPFLTPKPTVLGEGQGPIYIDDTVHCEDVHHYTPANLLFTACEDLITTRFDWFPGLGHLEAEAAGRGSIHVIDPTVSRALLSI